MHPIVRNTLAIIAGVVVGGAINMICITYGSTIIAPPAGVDPNDIASITAHAESYTWIHFLVPFIAHSLHSLVGAIIATKISGDRPKYVALAVGLIAMIGGIMMAVMIPAFWPYSIIDLLLAYVPMALIGWRIAR